MKTYVTAHEIEGRRVEVLLTEHDDGTREIATRQDPWATWSAPSVLAPAPNSIGVQP